MTDNLKYEPATIEQIKEKLPDFAKFIDSVIAGEISLSTEKECIKNKLDIMRGELLKFKAAGGDKTLSYTLLAEKIASIAGLKIGVATLRKYCQNELNFERKRINAVKKLQNQS